LAEWLRKDPAGRAYSAPTEPPLELKERAPREGKERKGIKGKKGREKVGDGRNGREGASRL